MLTSHWNLASLRRGAVDAEVLRRLLNRTQIDGVWDVSALQANVLISCIHRPVRWVPLASGDLNAVRAAPASEPWLVSRSALCEPLCDALGDLISPLRGALHSGGSISTEGSATACEPAMLASVLKIAGPGAAAVEAKRNAITNGGRESHQQAALGHDSSGLRRRRMRAGLRNPQRRTALRGSSSSSSSSSSAKDKYKKSPVSKISPTVISLQNSKTSQTNTFA